jgi:prephenate dehydrogenase
LAQLRQAIVAQDALSIEAIYSNAQRARHNWINAIESTEKQHQGGGD